MTPDDIDPKSELMDLAKFRLHVTFDLSGDVAYHARDVISHALRDCLERAIHKIAPGSGTLADLRVRFAPGDVTIEIDERDAV
jgi:hypothetical protein